MPASESQSDLTRAAFTEEERYQLARAACVLGRLDPRVDACAVAGDAKRLGRYAGDLLAPYGVPAESVTYSADPRGTVLEVRTGVGDLEF